MLTKLAMEITSFFCAHEMLNAEKYDWYVYAIEKKLVSRMGLLSMLLFGTVISDFFSTGTFIAGFYILRSWAGGYHASSFARCLALSVFTVFFNASFVTPLFLTSAQGATVVAAIIASVIVFALGSVDTPNYQVSTAEVRKRDMATRILISGQLSIAVLLLSFASTKLYGVSLTSGMCFVAISSIVGKIKEENGK